MVLHKVIVVTTIAIVITLMASATSLTLQQVDASRDGFEDGKRDGVSDRQSDRGFDDDCYEDGLYCLAYKAGYRFGYEVANSMSFKQQTLFLIVIVL